MSESTCFFLGKREIKWYFTVWSGDAAIPTFDYTIVWSRQATIFTFWLRVFYATSHKFCQMLCRVIQRCITAHSVAASAK